MMKKNLLWDTLHAVEQVEVAFEETLRTIDNINHRYKLVSALKKLAFKRQSSYEAEIQAAITAPSYRTTPLFTCTKISSASHKRRRKHKKYKNKLQLKMGKLSKSKMRDSQTELTACPSLYNLPPPPPTPIDEEIPNNVVCLRTNTIYEIKQETRTQRVDRTKGIQSYRNRIRKLHEAAHKKLEQDARAISNGRGKERQSDREQYNDDSNYSDQDRKLSTCNVYCSSSCSCQCEYF